MGSIKIYYPLKGSPKITGRFGKRTSIYINGVWTLPFHYGVDWAVPTGTPIYAAMAGTVTKNSWDRSGYGGGNEVSVTSGNHRTWYLHLQKPSHLRVGAKVQVGDLIGYVGNSGLSTGPHLHFEYHIKGAAVDPEKYLTAPPNPKPKPVDKNKDKIIPSTGWEEEDDGMYRPTVHVRTEGNFEATRAHPEIGKDLKAGQSRKDGKVTVFRGYEVTTDNSIATAWARTHAGGSGNETSRTNRAGYIAIQKEATRISLEIVG